MTVKIDVISDVVCPWCFIGKRKLESALQLYRERHPQASAPIVTWHPFQLNPDLPPEGVDRDEYLRRKFGKRADDIYARVTEAGASVDIPFAFGKVVRQPNTLAAHSLIALAGDAGRQDEVVEALFRAYFVDGQDLTSNETLVSVASAAGLEPASVTDCLASGNAREHMLSEDLQSRELGVDGVPFFIFNRRYAVSGAQDPETLLGAMLKAEE
jgi:predicted DsbA family dithiol-disulfide isomerase